MTIHTLFRVLIPMTETLWNKISSDAYYRRVGEVADGRPHDLDQEIGYDYIQCESLREAVALETQVEALVAQFQKEVDEDGIPF